MRARPSPRIFARLGVLYSGSFVGASHPHSDSLRAIIAWLEVCRCVGQLPRLQVLTFVSQGLPAPPLDVYLRYQNFLLVVEEREHRNAITASAEGLLATEVEQLPPPMVPDLAPSQSSVKDMLGYLQDHVAMFVGWLLEY